MKFNTLFACFTLVAPPAIAEQMPLSDYLNAMDRAEVTFAGEIKYVKSDDDFTFHDEKLGWFGVTIDAGRDVREQIETDCEISSWMTSYEDICLISGSGTVEIRGSRIYISIEVVDQLSKP